LFDVEWYYIGRRSSRLNAGDKLKAIVPRYTGMRLSFAVWDLTSARSWKRGQIPIVKTARNLKNKDLTPDLRPGMRRECDEYADL